MNRVHPTTEAWAAPSAADPVDAEYEGPDLRLEEELGAAFTSCVTCILRVCVALGVAIWVTCLGASCAIPHVHDAFSSVRAADDAMFYALAIGMPLGFLLASCCCCCCCCCACGAFSATEEEKAEAQKRALLTQLTRRISMRMSTLERTSVRISAYALQRVSARASATYRGSQRDSKYRDGSARGARSSVLTPTDEWDDSARWDSTRSSARDSVDEERGTHAHGVGDDEPPTLLTPAASSPARQHSFSTSEVRSVVFK